MSPRAFDRVMVDLEVGNHVKLRRLNDTEFRCFLAGILPIAAKAPHRGCLLVGHENADAADIAHQAGVKRPAAAASAMVKLRAVGVIYTDDDLGCERVHDFEDWNPGPKKDPGAAERMRRYRESRAANGSESGDRNDRNVTARYAANDRNCSPAKRREVEEKEEEAAARADAPVPAPAREAPAAPLTQHPDFEAVMAILVAKLGQRAAMADASIDSALLPYIGKPVNVVRAAADVASAILDQDDKQFEAASLPSRLRGMLRKEAASGDAGPRKGRTPLRVVDTSAHDAEVDAAYDRLQGGAS